MLETHILYIHLNLLLFINHLNKTLKKPIKN
jgi:hypothetical protein